MAVETGNLEKVLFLLRKGANVNATDSKKVTPLHLAIQFRHLHLVETLVTNGANVEAETCDGSKPIHMVNDSSEKRKECIEELLKYNVDLDAIDIRGNTLLLLMAKKWPSPELIRLLLDNTSDASNTDFKLNNCLHCLAMLTNVKPEIYKEATYILTERGIDVNAINMASETPLHKAVSYGNLPMAACLLRHGARLDMLNKQNLNPFELAIKRGNSKMKLLIMKYAFIHTLNGIPIPEKIHQDIYSDDELRCLWHRLDKDLIHFENSVRFDGRFPFTPFQILSGRVYMYPTLISSLDPSTAMVGEPRSAFFDEVLETWELTVRRIKDIYSERKDFTTIGLPIIRPKSHMRGL